MIDVFDRFMVGNRIIFKPKRFYLINTLYMHNRNIVFENLAVCFFR